MDVAEVFLHNIEPSQQCENDHRPAHKASVNARFSPVRIHEFRTHHHRSRLKPPNPDQQPALFVSLQGRWSMGGGYGPRGGSRKLRDDSTVRMRGRGYGLQTMPVPSCKSRPAHLGQRPQHRACPCLHALTIPGPPTNAIRPAARDRNDFPVSYLRGC